MEAEETVTAVAAVTATAVVAEVAAMAEAASDRVASWLGASSNAEFPS